MALFIFVQLVCVLGDLPLHCLLEDAAGEWVFHISEQKYSTVPACGHSVPNSVKSMLELDTESLVGEKYRTEHVVLTETVEPTDTPHFKRQVRAESGSASGSWSMIFDTGFEVRVKEETYLMSFAFTLLPGVLLNQTRTGDSWTLIGKYEGRKDDTPDDADNIYACHCDKTSAGWVRKGDDFHCAYGYKTTSEPVRSLAMMKGDKYVKLRAGDVESHAQDHVLHSLLPQRQERKSVLVQDEAESNDLPASYDWRDHITFGSELDQGPCGSCWAFTVSMMFESRFRIAVKKEYGVEYPINVSWPYTFKCNPYGEGCSGGWALQAARFLSDSGIPEMQPKESEDGVWKATPVCPKDLDSRPKFYASDYGYVGGFSHGSSEKSIMEEMYKFGPVAISANTDAIVDFWRAGNGSRMTRFKNSKMAVEEFSSAPEVNKWYYTTHSMLLVGWGEDKLGPYWTIRNSWGPGWGKDGYAKVRRGQNDAAIETSAVWVEADVARLPANIKKAVEEKAKAKASFLHLH